MEDEGRMQIYEFGAICSIPMALNTIVKLKVPEIISNSGNNSFLSANEITAQIPSCKSRVEGAVQLDRILRVLASWGIFKEVVVVDEETSKPIRKYGLTNASKWLIGDGCSLAPWVLFNTDEIYMKTWHFLHETVLNGGQPFTKAHGKTEFELAGEDSRLNQFFNDTMSNLSKMVTHELVKAYKAGFESVKTLVDVGGGTGSTIGFVTQAFPHIRGVNFDLPHVVVHAPDYNGVEHVGGDMFQSVPKGDAIFMKWVLHDWDDESCVKILKNCYESLPDDGKVIVVEAVLPSVMDSHEPVARCALVTDLLMLAYTPGGKERTKEEFVELAKAAGFQRIEVVTRVDFYSVLEFYKM